METPERRAISAMVTRRTAAPGGGAGRAGRIGGAAGVHPSLTRTVVGPQRTAAPTGSDALDRVPRVS
ncbi:hypothetical protein NUM3379_37120 [Kineococcus sp. NUM-3379]